MVPNPERSDRNLATQLFNLPTRMKSGRLSNGICLHRQPAERSGCRHRDDELGEK